MSYLKSIKANLEDRKDIYKKRLTYVLSLSLIVLIALLAYFLLTGKKPVAFIPVPKLQQPSYAYSVYGSGKIGELKTPTGLAVSAKLQRIYVADLGNRRIAVFDLEGKPLLAFSKISGGKELQNPAYVALDVKDNVYVSDTMLSKICVFNKEGRFLSYFRTSEKFNPLGLLFDKAGNLYVADKAGGRVLKLSSEGKKIAQFGSPGKTNEPGKDLDKLYFPSNILLRPKKVLVNDSNNKRIQVFNTDGKAQKVIPASGYIRGLAFYGSEKSGYMFTSRVFSHRIVAVNEKGKFLYSLGGEGSGDGQFLFPNDITVSGTRLYIADTQNNRIQVWAF